MRALARKKTARPIQRGRRVNIPATHHRRLVLNVLVLALFTCSLVHAQSGPIGHWKLDEGTGTSTADASGSGSTGTLANSPTWSTGRINSALTFSGNRYVTTGTPSNLTNLYSTGMTVTAWIKPASAGTGNGGRIVDKSNGGAGWSFKMNGSTKVQFAASEFATTDATRDSGASITLNAWQHVSVTWTGSATATNIHLYVNGTLSDGTATNGAGASRDDSAAPFAIGNRPVDAARGFDGLIDDVRVYNRVLTSTEIQTLADSTVPSAPTSPTASAASGTQIDVSWTASTDNVAVTNYLVERCTGASCSTFAEVGTPAASPFSNTGLTASTTYRYRIRATDANTNKSSYSSTVNATTTSGGDTQAPTVPTGLIATAVSSSQINLSWTASTDNVAVTGYVVDRCQGSGCTSFAQVGTPVGTTFNDSPLSGGTLYRYRVRARDAIPNYSADSSIASATTLPPPDTTAPTVPGNPTATPVSSAQINVGWTASTDNVAVTGYDIQRCQGSGCSSFTAAGTSGTTSFSDAGLAASTLYRYQVRAHDAVPNNSGWSTIAQATTLSAPDTQAPTIPGGLSATAAANQITLNWSASTDNVAVIEYQIERCQGVNCSSFASAGTTSSTTFTDSSLTPAVSYTYRVRARDAVPNYSGWATASPTVPADCD